MIRGDLRRPARVAFDDEPWVPSPEPGVDRKYLERDGGEIARATSIVRYRAGSRFPEHAHELGEEFLVLDGTFSDEHGDYPAGSYVRNPPGSRHRPFSIGGCTIFVKLRQILSDDRARVVIRPDGEPWPAPQILHAFAGERVAIARIAPAGGLALPGYSELLVLAGSLHADGASCAPWTWLRTAETAVPLTSATGGVCWIKQGHLHPAPA